MHHTFKGIYMKSASRAHPDPRASAEITNILYENITMEEPEQVCELEKRGCDTTTLYCRAMFSTSYMY